jgi:hypothetical protein
MSRRDPQFKYALQKDRDAARQRFPHPTVMNVGTGHFHDALDALDEKDKLIEQAIRLLENYGPSDPIGWELSTDWLSVARASCP